jgi:hypothetical protein
MGQFEFRNWVVDAKFAVSALISVADGQFKHPIWRDGPTGEIAISSMCYFNPFVRIVFCIPKNQRRTV